MVFQGFFERLDLHFGFDCFGVPIWMSGIGGMDLAAAVEKVLRRERILPNGEAVLAAVSGGLDSMVLLDVLHGLAGKRGWDLTAAHFNHGLRGEESDADEQLAREVAERLGLDFVGERADVGLAAKAKGISLEMAGRELRHRFLARIAEERGMGWAALGHHADDQLELFFLRALRGAGSEGLGGMRICGRSAYSARLWLVRPFLERRKADLRAYAKARGLVFREDATNWSGNVLRNRIRHELLPCLAGLGLSSVEKNVLRSMRILADEHQFVEAQSREWLRGKGRFSELAAAVQREVLRLELLRLGVAPSFSWIELLRHLEVGQVVEVCGGRRLQRDEWGRLADAVEESVSFLEAELLVELAGGEAVFFGGLELRFTVQTIQAVGDGRDFLKEKVKSGLGKASFGVEFFDDGLLEPRIRLRHWRSGDCFWPIGMAGTVKLQDWFVNEKVPMRERRLRVMAESEKNGLFWVEGMRIGERFKVGSGTKRVVRLEWRRRDLI